MTKTKNDGGDWFTDRDYFKVVFSPEQKKRYRVLKAVTDLSDQALFDLMLESTLQCPQVAERAKRWLA